MYKTSPIPTTFWLCIPLETSFHSITSADWYWLIADEPHIPFIMKTILVFANLLLGFAAFVASQTVVIAEELSQNVSITKSGEIYSYALPAHLCQTSLTHIQWSQLQDFLQRVYPWWVPELLRRLRWHWLPPWYALGAQCQLFNVARRLHRVLAGCRLRQFQGPYWARHFIDTNQPYQWSDHPLDWRERASTAVQCTTPLR